MIILEAQHSSMSKTFKKLHIGENFFSLINVIYKKKKKEKEKKNLTKSVLILINDLLT